MSKTYKIKVNQGADSAKFVDIPQVGTSGKALTVKAVPGGKYQLMDASTGFAPENIRATRLGKDLQVFFEGRGQADLVIEDYYEVTPEGFNGLIGEAESGRFYEYIPESAVGNTAVPLLADGSTQVGMALGGAEINASGAAVGALVAAAGLNPLFLAPLALLGAAAGGGGGGGGGTTGPLGDKGLKIESMSVDSGVGSFNPLDDSRKDFKTNDNTPVFTGTLTTVLPQGEKIAIQLVKDGVVVESGFATVSGTGWTWAPKAPLADATYKLNAQVVDAAGNPASEVVNGAPIAPASKDVVIDTKGPTDGTDPNSGLKISGISISSDTAANGINNDFVTSDGGNKDKSLLVNEDDKLTLTGTLSSAFDKNGGKVLVQIVGMDGKIKSSAYVEPTGSNWTYEHIGALTEGQYVAKTILLDHVGNMINAKDQSFIVDITASVNNNSKELSNTNSEIITKFEFGDLVSEKNENGTNTKLVYTYGTYKYGNLEGEYFGGNLNLGMV
jgi:hypothetical protein